MSEVPETEQGVSEVQKLTDLIREWSGEAGVAKDTYLAQKNAMRQTLKGKRAENDMERAWKKHLEELDKLG